MSVYPNKDIVVKNTLSAAA